MLLVFNGLYLCKYRKISNNQIISIKKNAKKHKKTANILVLRLFFAVGGIFFDFYKAKTMSICNRDYYYFH